MIADDETDDKKISDDVTFDRAKDGHDDESEEEDSDDDDDIDAVCCHMN